MSDKSKFKCFIDQIGRVVVGDLVSEDKTTFSIDTPVIVHVQPNTETGQLSVQVFPYIFVEFIDSGARDSNVWHFNKAQIISSDVVLDNKIVEAYRHLKEGAPDTEQIPDVVDADEVKTDGSESNVVDIFDK